MTQSSDSRSPWLTPAVAIAMLLLLVGAVAAYNLRESAPASGPAARTAPPAVETKRTVAERGQAVFTQYGCGGCHGAEGKGGVENPNYVLGTVPALNEMADRLMLFEREDAEAFAKMIEDGTSPHALRDKPPFAGYPRFLAQYDAVIGVIKNGAKAAKKDPNGPEPPFQMLAWSLTDEEIDTVLVYLVSLYPWEEEDDE